ncbi:MAG: hypothetical protein KBF32_00085 [Chitinophagales bacterium]|nr:hypothetical protein [Chitinophagaceae bacterium]MBP9881770.1 hypothetical protein [Chitinophagales bacterium]
MNSPVPSFAPFRCTFSPQLPELLLKLNCSIAITTYQAGKLVFISPADENICSAYPDKPFGQTPGKQMIIHKFPIAKY